MMKYDFLILLRPLDYADRCFILLGVNFFIYKLKYTPTTKFCNKYNGL